MTEPRGYRWESVLRKREYIRQILGNRDATKPPPVPPLDLTSQFPDIIDQPCFYCQAKELAVQAHAKGRPSGRPAADAAVTVQVGLAAVDVLVFVVCTACGFSVQCRVANEDGFAHLKFLPDTRHVPGG